MEENPKPLVHKLLQRDTEITKWQLVNAAETIEQLLEAIHLIAEDGMIQGRTKQFLAEKHAINVKAFYDDYDDEIPANVVTRNYGIRAQLLYLKHYKYDKL